MAIGRGSMTKELVGNRVKKMQAGGMVAPAPVLRTPLKKGGKVAKKPSGGKGK